MIPTITYTSVFNTSDRYQISNISVILTQKQHNIEKIQCDFEILFEWSVSVLFTGTEVTCQDSGNQ